MTRICDISDCGRDVFGKGYCHTHYYRLVRKPKQLRRMASCAWCGQRKPIEEMRHPDSSRGKTPSTCHECRTSNPNESWCDFHGQTHPKSEFRTNARPIGVEANCRRAEVIKASRSRGHAPIACVSCGSTSESWNFRGGRAKCPTCRDCEQSHPGMHWCVDCADWLPRALFAQTGQAGRYWTVRCRPCRAAHSHGVTVAQILEAQGSTRPECACCGSVDFLKIDHDHRCCPTSQGCPKCVRGYLCHECNTSEGLLRTASRARMLVAYMERHNL